MHTVFALSCSKGGYILKICTVLFLAIFCLWQLPAIAAAQVAILCYHELDKPRDGWAVTTDTFERHLKYLQQQQYHFVSLDEYIAYTSGQQELPEKSVMITFDDGYKSFYTKAYPLLQKYNVPAMLAIVSSWTNGEGKPTDVRDLASWDELREMEKSGLVTVVSHSYHLHENQAINPQGDLAPVASNRLYTGNGYESDEIYAARLHNDFARTQELFAANLGHPSKAVVWPYGAASGKSIEIAMSHGMSATFLLNGGVNEPQPQYGQRARRMIIGSNTNVSRLNKLLTVSHDAWNSLPLRLAQVDIDGIYDPDQRRMSENMASLMDRLNSSNVTTVALQAFADPAGNGNIEKVYFHNSVVPVAADVFNSIANRIQQDNIFVVAWMPGLSYQSLIAADGSNMVQSAGEAGWYRRLSPFDTAAMNKVAQLYEELGKYTVAEGILFQDDLYLNDFEDISPAAAAAYQAAFGKAYDAETAATAADAGDDAWAALKRQQLDDVTERFAAAFKKNRPDGVIMRDIYSEPVTNPASQTWFAQSYADYLQQYDYTVIMAYPYMDQAEPEKYLAGLADAVKKAGGTDKTIMKIQSLDWNEDEFLSARDFNSQMKLLKKLGIRNLGYYPDTWCTWTGAENND